MAYFKNEFRSVLYVDDFEASTKFYGEGLELRSNYSWDDGPDDRGVKYLAAGGVIEVIRRDPPIAQGSTTLMLEAEDVNACYQAMKKKDWLIFLEDLADRPYGIRCFRLLDPNKNDIVIFSYLKDRKRSRYRDLFLSEGSGGKGAAVMENGVFRVQIYTKEYEQMRHFYGTVLRLPVLVCRETGRDDRVCVAMVRHPA